MSIKPEVFQRYAAERPELTTFIETGTFEGITAIQASDYYREVHTIELLPEYYRRAQWRIKALGPNLKGRITCWCGDSPEVLRNVIELLSGPAFFYLDAHYSGFGPTPEVLPLWGELQTIFESGRKGDVIAIDDIRLCGDGQHAGWGETTLTKLVEALISIDPSYEFRLEPGFVLGDVLVAATPLDEGTFAIGEEKI